MGSKGIASYNDPDDGKKAPKRKDLPTEFVKEYRKRIAAALDTPDPASDLRLRKCVAGEPVGDVIAAHGRNLAQRHGGGWVPTCYCGWVGKVVASDGLPVGVDVAETGDWALETGNGMTITTTIGDPQ